MTWKHGHWASLLSVTIFVGFCNVANLAADPGAASVTWRLPVPPSQEGCGLRAAAGTCVTISAGDSAGLITALLDGDIDEIWLAGDVSLPPQTRAVHVERDLLIGGLQLNTVWHFQDGGMQPFLVFHGFTAMVNLRLSGLVKFRSLNPREDEGKYQLLGVAYMEHLTLGDRMPSMPPFPQQWITGGDIECTNGLAFYQCDILFEKGGILELLFSPDQIEALTLQNLMLKLTEQNLNNRKTSQWFSASNRPEFAAQTNLVVPSAGFFSELVVPDSWPCAYMVNSSMTFQGEEADSMRLPSPRTLHDGLGVLETECQTRMSVPGGKDYAGDVNMSWSGKPCVPWKDVDFFDLDFSYIPGNSCRNPGDAYGVFCFVELDPEIRDVGEESIRQPPRYVKESCNVPECGLPATTECQRLQDRGATYAGNISVSQTGKQCLPWASVNGGWNTFGKDNNNCKNPLNMMAAVWCYTQEDGTYKYIREFCDVPICTGNLPSVNRTMITTTDAYPEWFVDRENLSLLPTPSPSGSEAVISPSEGSLEGNSIQIGTLIATALGLIAIAAIIGAGWCFVVRSQEAAKLKQELEESRRVSVSLSEQNSKIINERRDSNFINESSIRSSIGLTKRADALNVRLESPPTELGIIKLHGLAGKGITSFVYHGEWMDSDVAVKVIRLGTLPMHFRKTLVESVEATRLLQICHPNVVQTYMVFEVGKAVPLSDDFDIEELWILQEWCDLGDLELSQTKVHGNQGEEEFQAMLRILIDIIKGIKYLHSIGIVHGDLKLANVLQKSHVKHNHICKVTDLGMAHTLEDKDYYFGNSVVGDFACMAPEAIFDHKVSAKMDTYSIGILMYELFTGKGAFRGGNFAEHCRTLASMHRPKFPPDTPEIYRILAERCWSQDPDKRPSDNEILCVLQGMSKHDSRSSGDSEARIDLDRQTSESALEDDYVVPTADQDEGYVIPEEDGNV